MASTGGGSGSTNLEERREADDGSETETGSSYSGSDTHQEAGTHTCQWRSRRFHDQECSRYFDCPTHLVERRLSVDETEADNEGREEVTSISMPARRNDESRESQLAETTNPRSYNPDASATALRQTGVPSPTEAPSYPIRTSSAAAGRSAGSLGQQAHQHEDDASTSSGSDDLYQESDEEARPQARRGNPDPSRTITPGSLDWSRRHSVPYPQAARASHDDILQHSPPHHVDEAESSSELVLPRWQPDAEVTYCPICHSQFSIFVRKHHCRKCGRVVCNSCSPHRIIIPHQYIVRPPGSEIPLPQSLLLDGLGGGYFDVNGLSGGERVRLCNPCVPDPNTAPPHTPSPPVLSPRASHYRTRSSLGNTYGAPPHTNRYGAVFAPGSNHDPYRYYSSRSRSVTMSHSGRGTAAGPSSRAGGVETYRSPLHRLQTSGPLLSPTSTFPTRFGSVGDEATSSRHRVLPPPPQIAEEDECPICHRELPSRSLANYEALRENHITTCIQSHSQYGSPRSAGGDNLPPVPPRRTGMYAYPATEKDCVDDAECTICLEEFTVGVRMARLECLCRFHYSCISAWFVNHPGRCPVHQHDGFGY